MCQKNVGSSYLPSVCESADLSPGVHAEQYARRLEEWQRKSAERKKSVQFMRRRLQLKVDHKAKTQSSELQEGNCQ